MIKIHDIILALKRLLLERFPDVPPERIYTSGIPTEFTRPAILLKCGKVKMEDANRESVQMTLPIIIDHYIVVGDSDSDQLEELTRRMLAAQELFAVEGLRIGDRALQMVKNIGECHLDHTEVTVTLQYRDDRPGQQTDYPLMAELHTNIKEG